MMSSSRAPRAVQVHPRGAHPGTAVWSPDELPHALSGAMPQGAPPSEPVMDARLSTAAEDGYARGWQEGFKAGERAEAARLRTAVSALESALETVEQESVRWVGNAEENLCALAVTIARHVMGRELVSDRDRVLESVRHALAEFPVSEAVRVRLNPGDVQAVTTAMATDPAASGRPVRWSADACVGPGGCMIEGQERIVDGRIDTALERLYRRLTNAGS